MVNVPFPAVCGLGEEVRRQGDRAETPPVRRVWPRCLCARRFAGILEEIRQEPVERDVEPLGIGAEEIVTIVTGGADGAEEIAVRLARICPPKPAVS